MEKLKILYVINSSHKKAGGGHFYSLLTIVDSLTPYIDFKILNVGLVHADTLKNNVSSDFIKITKLNFLFQIPKLSRYVREYRPNVIHCFDPRSVSIMRAVNFITKKPLIFSKCGGVNGGRFIQDADAYINFSEENADHIIKYKKNKNPTYTLPNRATKVNIDRERIKALCDKYNVKTNQKIIIRISRFHTHHENSIFQAINLLKKFVDSKPKEDVRLFLIGIPQDPTVVKRVENAIEKYPIQLITDKLFTNKASELLDIADIVVGTGRGVMEAASLKKIIFAPIKNSVYPAPVDEKNFKGMMYYNFSERNIRADITSDEILNHLNISCEKNKEFIEYIFTTYFDIFSVIEDYLKIYKTTSHVGLNFNSFLNYIEDFIRFSKPAFISKHFYEKNSNK